MVYNFGAIAAGHRVDVQLFFVTGSEEEAARLSKRFVNSAYHVTVTWVRADTVATEVIKDAMAANITSTPSAIIIDYDSFGSALWSFFRSLRAAIGGRYVEYVIVDLPAGESELAELQAANVTAMPAAASATCF